MVKQQMFAKSGYALKHFNINSKNNTIFELFTYVNVAFHDRLQGGAMVVYKRLVVTTHLTI